MLELLAGVVLLVAGKRLFWLAVGLAGFFVGFQIGLNYFESPVASWGCGIVLGLIGIMLAIGLQSMLIVLSGLLLGHLQVWYWRIFYHRTLKRSPGFAGESVRCWEPYWR